MDECIQITKEKLIEITSEILQRAVSHRTREVCEDVSPKTFNAKFRRYDMGLMYGKLSTMNLVDLSEMVTVLSTYSQQMKKDIFAVIAEHRKLFNYSEELEEILGNTCRYMGWVED